MELFGIGICALCAAIFGTLLKRSNREYALLITTLAAVLILSHVAEQAAPYLSQLGSLEAAGEIGGECLSVMLKAVGITIAGQTAASLCKDAGEATLAFLVETAAKVCVLATAFPIVLKIFDLIGEIMRV